MTTDLHAALRQSEADNAALRQHIDALTAERDDALAMVEWLTGCDGCDECRPVQTVAVSGGVV